MELEFADLEALIVLAETLHFGRAADRLHVSQPALSKTLQKLREAFEDELFTRTSHGLIPTPRADELAAQLPGLLKNIDLVLGDAQFSPARINHGCNLFRNPEPTDLSINCTNVGIIAKSLHMTRWAAMKRHYGAGSTWVSWVFRDKRMAADDLIIDACDSKLIS